MKFAKILTGTLALAMALGGVANADTFTGLGDGTSWEDPLNWEAGVVPLNNASGNTLIAVDFQVVFDADSLAAVVAAGNTQPNGQYRIARLLLGDQTAGATNGTHSMTFDHDGDVLVTNGTSAVIGGRPNKFSTLNIVNGITNIEANRVRVGQGVDGTGTINVSGGDFRVGRGGLELGSPDNTLGAPGQGTLNFTGGSLTTRNDVEIFTSGLFNIVGNAANSVIGVGSFGTTDGHWIQDGTLRLQVDAANGITPIFVDDVDLDGSGASATFNAGSILDLSFLGSPAAATTTYTILELEGADIIDNGLALSPTTNPAWSFAVDNSGVNGLLTVTYTASGAVLKGDVNLDGGVSFLDINPFIGVLAGGSFQTEADCDCSGGVDFLDIQAFINILSGQ